MPRLMLSHELWSKLRGIMLQNGIYAKPNLRSDVEGMLYRMRVGCPWRDIRPEFGKWNAIYKRFNSWSSKGKLLLIFRALVEQPDLEWAFIDGSDTKAHQHSTGAAGGQPQAIGKSRAGNTTKIHWAVDSDGLPVTFDITGSELSDYTMAAVLIEQLPEVDSVVADKGYDSKKNS